MGKNQFVRVWRHGMAKRLLVVSMLILLIATRLLPVRPVFIQATHGGGPPHLYLLWDSASSPPSGWSVVTTYDGFFVRGDSVANYGTTNSSGAHVPTVATNTVGAASGTYYDSGGGTNVATSAHTHTGPSVTIGAADNSDEPAHRVLKLIRYDNGIPTFIPAGVIAMFDTLPTSGWTTYSAATNRFLKLGSSVGDGGTDAHQHSLTFTSNLGNASGSNGIATLLASQPTSTTTHTHTPTNTTTASTTTFPPHVRPLIAKADSNTVAIPANLLGFFDATPGTGWVVRSESGGDFNGQFLRMSTTFSATSSGSTSHTHTQVVAATGNNSGGNPGNTRNLLANALATTHTHNVTLTFNSVENVPNYVNLVVAEKINFILRDYRWYEDSDDEDVTNPWGRIDVAQNTQIFIIPARNDPPYPTQELRLRLKLEVSGQDLPPSGIAFTLQYTESTDSDCSAGSWTDVGASGGGSIWRFASSSETNGVQLSVSRLSPSASVRETYNKQNPTSTNASTVTVGQGIEYDFHIEHNGASNATRYKFRIIESTGPPLAEYAQCPALTTKPGTENLLRHGNVYEGGAERGFSWAD